MSLKSPVAAIRAGTSSFSSSSSEASSSKAPVLKLDFGTVTCTVCDEDCPRVEAATLPAPCRHSYCPPCLRAYVGVCIADKAVFPPGCCKTRLPLSTRVRTILGPDLTKQLELATMEHDDPDATYCANKACSAYLQLEGTHRPSRGTPAVTSLRHSQRDATCPECNEKTCCACRYPSHKGRCTRSVAEDMVRAWAASKGWRDCYKCKTIVERNGGCDHITCRCGAQFCYLCGVRYPDCGLNCQQPAALRTPPDDIAAGRAAAANAAPPAQAPVQRNVIRRRIAMPIGPGLRRVRAQENIQANPPPNNNNDNNNPLANTDDNQPWWERLHRRRSQPIAANAIPGPAVVAARRAVARGTAPVRTVNREAVARDLTQMTVAERANRNRAANTPPVNANANTAPIPPANPPTNAPAAPPAPATPAAAAAPPPAANPANPIAPPPTPRAAAAPPARQRNNTPANTTPATARRRPARRTTARQMPPVRAARSAAPGTPPHTPPSSARSANRDVFSFRVALPVDMSARMLVEAQG